MVTTEQTSFLSSQSHQSSGIAGGERGLFRGWREGSHEGVIRDTFRVLRKDSEAIGRNLDLTLMSGDIMEGFKAGM